MDIDKKHLQRIINKPLWNFRELDFFLKSNILIHSRIKKHTLNSFGDFSFIDNIYLLEIA